MIELQHGNGGKATERGVRSGAHCPGSGVLQLRSEVSVAGVSISPPAHGLRMFWHARSVVAVGAVVWNCAPVQVTRVLHLRSVVLVGAAVWNSDAVQAERVLHWRSEVLVGGASSNCAA